MPETELSRALQDLTPEPPKTLYAEELMSLARRRRRTRVAVLSSAPVVVAVVLAAALHGSGSPSSQAVSEPTPTSIATSPVPAPSPPPVTDMHSDSAPAGPLTVGNADVDGDGRIDRVTVSSATGGVTVALGSGGILHAVLPNPDQSFKLQALPDLFATGTREVLVYSSAAGCCGYAPVDSASYVLAVVGGELVVVRDAGGQPLQLFFSDGRGGFYGSIECRATGHDVLQSAINTSDKVRLETTISLSGGTATVSPPKTSPDQRTEAAIMPGFKVAVGCTGLTSEGRATP